MRNLGLIALLCMTFSSSSMHDANAAPGIENRTANAPAAGDRMQRRERMERLETAVLNAVQAADAERYEKLIRLKTQRPRAYMHLIKSAKAFSKAKSDPKIRDLFMKAID